MNSKCKLCLRLEGHHCACPKGNKGNILLREAFIKGFKLGKSGVVYYKPLLFEANEALSSKAEKLGYELGSIRFENMWNRSCTY